MANVNSKYSESSTLLLCSFSTFEYCVSRCLVFAEEIFMEMAELGIGCRPRKLSLSLSLSRINQT
jgi:hypothetical protein